MIRFWPFWTKKQEPKKPIDLKAMPPTPPVTRGQIRQMSDEEEAVWGEKPSEIITTGSCNDAIIEKPKAKPPDNYAQIQLAEAMITRDVARIMNGKPSERELLEMLYSAVRMALGEPRGKPLTNEQILINLFAIVQTHFLRQLR